MAGQNVKRINAQQRRYRILQMTLAGATQRQIAETEGISHGLVSKDLQIVLGELAKQNTGNADEVRVLQNERYKAAALRLWEDAMRGDLKAMELLLKVWDKINIINGIIPDKPLISMQLQQNTLNYNEAPVTFRIETANDNSDANLPTPDSLS